MLGMLVNHICKHLDDQQQHIRQTQQRARGFLLLQHRMSAATSYSPTLPAFSIFNDGSHNSTTISKRAKQQQQHREEEQDFDFDGSQTSTKPTDTAAR